MPAAKNARPMQTVVAYAGVMRAAVEAAQAFFEAGLLVRYETTLAYCPAGLPDRVLRAGARAVLRERAERTLQRRSIAAIPPGLVERRPAWDLMRAAAGRLGAGEVALDWCGSRRCCISIAGSRGGCLARSAWSMATSTRVQAHSSAPPSSAFVACSTWRRRTTRSPRRCWPSRSRVIRTS